MIIISLNNKLTEKYLLLLNLYFINYKWDLTSYMISHII
jgi:hypothetical protein